MKVNKSTLKLYSSAEAVIMQFLNLPGQDRVNNIVKRIMDFSEEEVKEHLSEMKQYNNYKRILPPKPKLT